MKVAVGSKNPAKIEAVRLAFEKVWPDERFEYVGVEVDSEVSNQPMSDEESVRGARNRAKKAITKLNADYGVGLEGGLHKTSDQWYDSGWIVVVNKKGHEGIGATLKMIVPEKMMRYILKEGKELGEVIDIVHKGDNLKQKEGHFGVMTKLAVTRATGYRDGVIAALSRFLHPHLWEK